MGSLAKISYYFLEIFDLRTALLEGSRNVIKTQLSVKMGIHTNMGPALKLSINVAKTNK